MTNKKTLIKIDVTDWDEEYTAREPNVSSRDEIIERAKEGVSRSEIARNVIIAREKGQAPKNIIRSNKAALNAGAAVDVHTAIGKRYEEINLKNGKTIEIREFTAPVTEKKKNGDEDRVEFEAIDEDNDNAIVESVTKKGRDNARKYLEVRVPAEVYSRLAIIASYNDGDNTAEVIECAEALKREIDEIVGKLA